MIIKVNTYLTDRNITNMALNVDYNRLGEDKTQISVNYGTTPATVTIKNGSIIECNGNRYLIDADYSFQMANAAHNYLTFTDNPAIAFSSAVAIGTFDAEKQGYYQVDNLTRTLKYYIDQAEEREYILVDAILPDYDIISTRYDKVKVGKTIDAPVGKIIFDIVDYDTCGNFDVANSRFVCSEPGQYIVAMQTKGASVSTELYKNGVGLQVYDNGLNGSANLLFVDMESGDYLELYVTASNWAVGSRFLISRLL